MQNFIYSLITFVVALFFTLFGIVSVLIPWSSTIRTAFISFLLEDAIAISLFGFGFLIIGILLICNLFLTSKRTYYSLRTGPVNTLVSLNVVEEYLKRYWNKLFPDHHIPCHVSFTQKEIHVVADLPYCPLNEQKDLIEKIEEDLGDIFSRYLGYHKSLLLSISFEPMQESVS